MWLHASPADRPSINVPDQPVFGASVEKYLARVCPLVILAVGLSSQTTRRNEHTNAGARFLQILVDTRRRYDVQERAGGDALRPHITHTYIQMGGNMSWSAMLAAAQ